MSKLLLDGYRPINKKWPVYTLNMETNTVDVKWFNNQKEGSHLGPQVGAGDFRKVGALGKRKEGFFAAYMHNDSLYLWLDGQCFDLISNESSITLKRDVDFLLRKRFRVFADGVQVFECRYSYLDYEDFSDTDIFWYMARNLSSMEGRVRALIILQDKLQKKDQSTEAYFQGLDVRVNTEIKNMKQAHSVI